MPFKSGLDLTVTNDLHEEINTLRQELESNINPSQHKLLLRLLDVQGYLKNDVSLESFAAGFKLAAGIAKELETDGLYSYDSELELPIKQDIR